MHRKHLQEIPSFSSNVSAGFTCDSSKTLEFHSGMGASMLQKDNLGNENMPENRLVSLPCPPQKRQKVKEKEKDFVIVRQPHLHHEAESDTRLSYERWECPQTALLLNATECRVIGSFLDLHQPEVSHVNVNTRSSVSTGASWDALPDELLLAIFDYLPLNDLLRVSLSCKRWHRLAFDESLWQTLDLTGRNLLPGVIGQLLPTGVTVFRCPRSCIATPLFKTSKRLRVQHMDLSNCTVSVADLESILCLCEKLQNLSMEGLVLSDDIIKSIAKNQSLMRLNLCGCSGFSAEALVLMLNNCSMLEELNLSWCNFTATHVKAAVNHVTSKVTQLNLSGYRQNLQIQDVKTLVERCPFLVHLDLSDSVMLKPECFQYFHQLIFLQHLCLSRCYQIPPAALVELGEIPTLQTLQVFGIVTDSSLQLLKETLPHLKINCSHFTSIARPTVGSKKNHEIWGIKCRLTLRNPSGL